MTIIEQIKAEVEKQIELHDSLASNAESEMIANLEIGAAQALDDLLSFLSNLETEKPLGLEEEIKRYYDDWYGECRYELTARHFAKWQKEQMMKEAVEGSVCGRLYDHINVLFEDGVCKYLEPQNISQIPADVSKYKVGDKVRIIIVKEGEK